MYAYGDHMEITEITPVLCAVCGKNTGRPDHGALSGTFGGKQYHVALCQACFAVLLGTAREMRRVSTMFTNSDAGSDDFGLKQP